jgi:hypothetical protein
MARLTPDEASAQSLQDPMGTGVHASGTECRSFPRTCATATATATRP